MITAPTFGEILDLAGRFEEDDWRAFAQEIHFPFADEFYLFEADPLLLAFRFVAGHLQVGPGLGELAAQAPDRLGVGVGFVGFGGGHRSVSVRSVVSEGGHAACV